VDASGRLTGIVARQALEGLPEAVRGSRTVGSVMASDGPESTLRVGLEDPLETLLGSEGLQRLGAVLAVDREGVLRGVVTVDAVRRALRPAAP
jgi:hypothetical protein